MRDHCLQLTSRQEGYNAKLNTMREYLQANILRALGDRRFFRANAFVGGTALRFMHGLPRFSEDLDFSLISASDEPFASLMASVKKELLSAGYQVEAKYSDQKTVFNAFFKFKGLMFDAGLSPLKDQNFSVKIEIDTKPPEGGAPETKTVNKFFPLTFLTFDLSSLFAGKIHALLTRKYTKGRDFFDLGWYLSRPETLEPNFIFLKNALKQTGYKEEMPTTENWRQILARVVDNADWPALTKDVENFLENPGDLNTLNKDRFLALLTGSK